jgi:hypothetical protein
MTPAVLLPAFALYWYVLGARRQLAVLSAAPALLAAVAIGAWTVRNINVMDEPVLLSANFGYNLRIGHNEDAIGRFDFLPEFWPPGEEGQLTRDREIAFNRDGARRAIRFAITHPVDEVRLSALKVYWLYRADIDSWIWIESFFATPFPSIELRWAMVRTISATYYAFMCVAILGLALMARDRNAPAAHERARAALVAAVTVLWTAVHIVFFGETRFHVPLYPLLCPVAAAAIWWTADNWRALSGRARQSAAVEGAPGQRMADVTGDGRA